MKRLQLGLCLPRIQSHLIIDETVASGIQLSKGEPEGFGCVKITFTWLCTILMTPPPPFAVRFLYSPSPPYTLLVTTDPHSVPPETMRSPRKTLPTPSPLRINIDWSLMVLGNICICKS